MSVLWIPATLLFIFTITFINEYIKWILLIIIRQITITYKMNAVLFISSFHNLHVSCSRSPLFCTACLLSFHEVKYDNGREALFDTMKSSKRTQQSAWSSLSGGMLYRWEQQEIEYYEGDHWRTLIARLHNEKYIRYSSYALISQQIVSYFNSY